MVLNIFVNDIWNVITHSKFPTYVHTKKKIVLSITSLIVLSHNQVLIPHVLGALHIRTLHNSKATTVTFSRKLTFFSSNTNRTDCTDCTDCAVCADCTDAPSALILNSTVASQYIQLSVSVALPIFK